MNNKLSFLSVLLLCSALSTVTLSNGASAALVGTADGALDTNTGLSWLNISKTINLSYAQVSAELNAGGLFAGYRFATFDEVMQLAADVGVARIYLWKDESNNHHAGTDYGPRDLSVFFNLIGTTNIRVPTGLPNSCSSEGAYGNIINGNALIQHVLCLSTRPPSISVDEINVRAAEGTFLSASTTTGSWLVSTVPIPASGLLMLPALLSLFGVRKYRQRRTF